jgi:hypothetical protein
MHTYMLDLGEDNPLTYTFLDTFCIVGDCKCLRQNFWPWILNDLLLVQVRARPVTSSAACFNENAHVRVAGAGIHGISRSERKYGIL